MKIHKLIYISLLFTLTLSSCIKDIDVEPLPLVFDASFTVQNSIKSDQSYYRFYENTVIEVKTAEPTDWDIAFESAGSGNRVVIGWASASTVVKTGFSSFSEITQDYILDLIANSDDWMFDDPAYMNYVDSLSLRDWEDGEIYLQSRGVESDNYYIIQFVSKDEVSYTFKYASAVTLNNVKEATIIRSDGYNYMYYSYNVDDVVYIDPNSTDWDLMFSPYLGWWESAIDGEFSPYIQSGALINNESGVRIARLFDPEIAFEDIDSTFIDQYEYTDMKGAIGSNWKVLGAVGSPNLYTMDPDKKYILKKFDYESGSMMYFKLQIIDYKLDGEDHHPTVAFNLIAKE